MLLFSITRLIKKSNAHSLRRFLRQVSREKRLQNIYLESLKAVSNRTLVTAIVSSRTNNRKQITSNIPNPSTQQAICIFTPIERRYISRKQLSYLLSLDFVLYPHTIFLFVEQTYCICLSRQECGFQHLSLFLVFFSLSTFQIMFNLKPVRRAQRITAVGVTRIVCPLATITYSQMSCQRL